MKIASLFSGIGGFEKGILQADPTAEFVFASEIDKYARSIYRKQFGVEPSGDITKINAADVPDHDILVAGVPCQSWSIAGKRGGFEDVRGTMWYEVFRIMKEKKPKQVILENVMGLLSHNGGKSFESICKEINTIGYIVRMEIYDTKDFGLPQNRKRIFLICTNIHDIINVGMNKKMTISKPIIQEWLFQILLNNLEEVVKLQGEGSKDLVLSYLILKELTNENGLKLKLRFSSKTKNYLSKNYLSFFLEENTLQSTLNQNELELKEKKLKDIITIEMDEKSFISSTEWVWQNIDILLSKNWEENYLGKNKYTISTAIKQIIDWKTFTYSQVSLAMLLLIGHLRTSSNHLWDEILSNLTVMREGMNYARIREIDEKRTISEGGNYYNTEYVNVARKKQFIIGHLGTARERTRKIFPIRKSDGMGGAEQSAVYTIDANYYKGPACQSRTMILCDSGPGLKIQTRTDTIAPLRANTGAGCNNVVPVVAKTITGGGHSGGNHSDMTVLKTNNRLRRLMPIEVEKLQGFPPGWTEEGIDDNGNIVKISDTRRYKSLGNAVSVPVIEFIFKHIMKVM